MKKKFKFSENIMPIVLMSSWVARAKLEFDPFAADSRSFSVVLDSVS